MNMTTGMLALSSTDGEAPRARRIPGNKGCNVWIGSTCIVGDAEAWRQLAAVALEAAAIEAECEATKETA